MATPFKSILSGAIFGAAITAAGVFSPSVIIGQLKLDDFHMLKTFLAASASSALAIAFTNHLTLTSAKPRSPNTLSLFSTYDGNIIGGALLGAGMALTGACPGTVLPQLAAGISSAPNVILGTFVGGILYSKLGKPLQQRVKSAQAIQKPTVYEQLGISRLAGLAGYETICIAMVCAASFFGEEKPGILVPATIGGLLIGISQLTSLLLTGNTLGISTAYEQVGDIFWWSLTSSSLTLKDETDLKDLRGREKTPRPTIKSTAFALGTFLGSWVAYQLVLSSKPGPRIVGNEHAEIVIGTARAVIGGIALIFGSRIAGGCTSGHGISGMSLGSISSIISVVSMFTGGILVANIVG